MGNLSNVDIFNARVSGHSMSEVVGKVVEYSGCEIYDSEVFDSNGQSAGIKEVVALKLDGVMYTSPSPTLVDAVKVLTAMVGDGSTPIKIKVVLHTSKSGREFLTLELADS